MADDNPKKTVILLYHLEYMSRAPGEERRRVYLLPEGTVLLRHHLAGNAHRGMAETSGEEVKAGPAGVDINININMRFRFRGHL